MPDIKFPVGPIIGLFIILVAVAILGITVLNQNLLHLNSTPSPTPTPVPTASHTPIPTPEVIKVPNDFEIYETDQFSISYPADWELNGTVFSIPQENSIDPLKVAEFSPGVVIPAEEISCNEIYERIIFGGDPVEALSGISLSFEQPIGEDAVIIRDVTQIMGRSWNTLSYEIYPEGTRVPAPWYPYQYCTQQDDKLFFITFYERQDGVQSLPQKEVLSTFEFAE